MIREQLVWQGKTFDLTWEPGPVLPSGEVTQASALCFTADGLIVLVSEDGMEWNLPEGHPEPHEHPDEALVREVLEEACATVSGHQYLGAQRVRDERGVTFYQLRYWARVDLMTFDPRFETRFRRCVTPAEFSQVLAWGQTRMATTVLESGLNAEQVFTAKCRSGING